MSGSHLGTRGGLVYARSSVVMKKRVFVTWCKPVVNKASSCFAFSISNAFWCRVKRSAFCESFTASPGAACVACAGSLKTARR